MCGPKLKAVACPADGFDVKTALFVQTRPDIQQRWLSPKTAMGAVLLGLFLFLHVLAASETLHHDFHRHDCDHPEQTCVVTTMAHGQVEMPSADVPLPLVSSVVTIVATEKESFVGFPISRLLPGRAPPVGLLA